MDDFIDDGSDCDQQRISEEIQSIFGYDKNRSVDLLVFEIEALVVGSMLNTQIFCWKNRKRM